MSYTVVLIILMKRKLVWTCENNIVLAAAKTNTLKNPLNCLISNREGLGKSLEIMGIATIDPHSQKEHSEIHKIPKFRVNQASFD